MQALNIETVKTALFAANAAYVARKGEKANVNKAGVNPDLAKALSIAGKVAPAQWAAIEALDVAPQLLKGLTDATNTKKPMRTLQAVLFALTGAGEYLKGSARTFILEFCGLAIAGAKTRAGLAFCATGKGNESTSDEVKMQKARAIIRAFGAVGVSTESTQNSVAFSAGGIAATLGVAHKGKRSGMPEINLENKVAQALDKIVSGMTDGKLALLVAQATERAK